MHESLPVDTVVTRLFPPDGETCGLNGLYLSLRLHRLGSAVRPFVYANFLSSLDGRIALEDDHNRQPYVPRDLTTPSDFRLFLELHAQADCLITHGGYLRALAERRLGNILQVGGHAAGVDLPAWRLTQSLAPQPDIVIASSSLEFPDPAPFIQAGQRVWIATGASGDPARIRGWRDAGYEVLQCGAGRVEAGPLTATLGALGYRSIYLIAGPEMLETMLRAGCLSWLFLTLSHQLLGGEHFRTKIYGDPLGNKGALRLRTLYLDPGSPQGCGQFFACFETIRSDQS